HIQMDMRIRGPRKSDAANLARLSRRHHRFMSPAFRKNTIRIVEADDLMMLHQIDMIGLQPFQASLDLPLGHLFGAPVDLRHQKYFLAIAVLQGLPHPDFALAFVVVPAVIHEGNAAVDTSSHQANAVLLCKPMLCKMEAAHADRRDFLAGASQRAVEHVALAGSSRCGESDRMHGFVLLRCGGSVLSEGRWQSAGDAANGGSLEKISAFHCEIVT